MRRSVDNKRWPLESFYNYPDSSVKSIAGIDHQLGGYIPQTPLPFALIPLASLNRSMPGASGWC